MLTFVNSGKVRPKRNPGYFFLRAGFVPDGHSEGGLVALRLLPDAMPGPVASLAHWLQPSIFDPV